MVDAMTKEQLWNWWAPTPFACSWIVVDPDDPDKSVQCGSTDWIVVVHDKDSPIGTSAHCPKCGYTMAGYKQPEIHAILRTVGRDG